MVPQMSEQELVALVYKVMVGDPLTEKEYFTYKSIPQDVLRSTKEFIFKKVSYEIESEINR